MKHVWLALSATLALSACATGISSTGYGKNADKLALYRAHVTEQVSSIPFSGSIHNWMPLGETALVVWTGPSRAWLLELGSKCPYMDYSYAIGFDGRDNRISAGFDSVVPLGGAGPNIPCRIDSIHRVDVPAVRAAERAQEAPGA